MTTKEIKEYFLVRLGADNEEQETLDYQVRTLKQANEIADDWTSKGAAYWSMVIRIEV